MQTLYDLAAPAKLNLFLHVTGRRPDGYHTLESLFVLIDWCDTLHIERTSTGEITREDLNEPLPEEDLTLRAARLLQKHTGTAWGAHIAVQKSIPTQAGLGGGSSDAATVLLALTRLWQLPCTLEDLCQLGLSLGADIPFFLQGQGAAFVKGIGEQVSPVQLPAFAYAGHWVVAKPSLGLSTKSVFSSPALCRNTPALADLPALPQLLQLSQDKDLLSLGHNDLQPVALALCPGLAVGLDWLAAQGLKGRMSGSGTALFAHNPQAVKLQTPLAGWQLKACQLLKAHPLAKWVPANISI
jgi:4-diphosphocytidyl-2-C-methyl-D-erythritol kinase